MRNHLWITALLAAPALSYAQGMPENCRAPMAHFMEMSAIPQLLHLPPDGPKIMGIVPTGNSHAREIGNGRSRIDCTISVSWDDGHVDENYNFSAWEKSDGGYGGSYASPKSGRAAAPAPTAAGRTRADAPAVHPAKLQDINAWTAEAAKNAGIGRGIQRFKTEQDFAGYQITIDYDPSFFTQDWAGREQAFATGDTYHLAEAFVQLLVKRGIDPSGPKAPQVVSVCAREGGFTSVTGKTQFANLGCSEYDPSKDAVSRNDRSD
ncbi:hypothetical protein [Burkholderia cepacia]|uniref:hypothetical protein n=1 Tax=Burkholderia cepacia TaxID=292 RepID=UPI000A6321AE|nr:hypothetical protein [Burkholderia cepacia]